MPQTVTDRFLTRAEVERRVGLRRSAIYEMAKRGTFPKPVKLGSKAVRWSEAEISAWIAERLRERQPAA